MVYSLAANFLWGSSPERRKIHKVSYAHCTLPKDMGGLGLLNIQQLTDKLSRKWVVRSFYHWDYWSALLYQKCTFIPLRQLKAWTGFSPCEILLSSANFKCKASKISFQFWMSWFKYKPMILIKPQKVLLFLPFDSIWFSRLVLPIVSQHYRKAHRLFKLGFKCWQDL